jgi:hypothetical protein
MRAIGIHAIQRSNPAHRGNERGGVHRPGRTPRAPEAAR